MITANEIRALLESSGSPLDDNSYKKLPAQDQRQLFGHVIFGRASVRLNGSRGVVCRWVVAYGLDYEIQIYSWEDLARGINGKGRVHMSGGFVLPDGHYLSRSIADVT